MDTNPRDQNLDTNVARAIRASLVEDNKSFHLWNRGILLSASRVTYDNRSGLARIVFEDPQIHGDIDGGHTLKIILREKEQLLAKGQALPEQYVEIEIIVGVTSPEDLAEARNNSVAVNVKSLEELTPELMRVAEHAAGSAYGLISLVVSFAMDVLDSLEHSPVYTAGTSHILDHPEYRDVGKAQKLMSYLTEDQSLANVLDLPALNEDNTKILIGPENVADELKDTSVVLASYDIGDGMKGVIGVVGPTRMDYAKVAAKLSYVADGLSKLFGQTELPPGKPEKEE